ncbi:MAG: hypothetical protein J2P16_10575 [Mycobacterium sp.]|nr:hypothetical protein [Mycobacterium sp.]
MALYDQNLTFFKTSPGQAVTATAVSELTYDILQGLALDSVTGVYPIDVNDSIVGRLRPDTVPRTKFWGEDLGLGRGPGTPTVDVYADPNSTPAGGTSIQVILQGAVDNGGGTIAGLTFVPYIESDVVDLAQLTANFSFGWYQLTEFDLPRRPIGTPLPRFLQLQYVAVGAWTGLNLKGYIGLGDTSAQDTLGQYPANF